MKPIHHRVGKSPSNKREGLRMIKSFRPMLAGKADLDKLTYPVYVSPKLDGIRAIIKDGVVFSRSLKPIPNKHIQAKFGGPTLEGFDGELIYGAPTAPDVYRQTNSVVMSHDKEEGKAVAFHVFDLWNLDMPFAERIGSIHPGIYLAPGVRDVVVVNQTLIHDRCDLEDLIHILLIKGYEGAMVRDPAGKYKFGRSTTKEGALLKYKEFSDSEAEIVGFEELMHNNNVPTIGELGQIERSSHKENLVPKNVLGALVVRDIHTGVEFKIGTGFDAIDRETIWLEREAMLGTVVKYKSFSIGVKDKPRHPVFLGFREEIDL